MVVFLKVMVLGFKESYRHPEKELPYTK